MFNTEAIMTMCTSFIELIILDINIVRTIVI